MSLDLPTETRRLEPVPATATTETTATNLPNLAGAIRRLRKRNGLSQRELARRMQVPRTYVSKIENDKATPTLASLGRLAEAMETTIAGLLQFSGDGDADSLQVRSLLADRFIRDLLPYVQQLHPTQREFVLTELQRRSKRAHG